MIAERFPDHVVLGEEFAAPATARRAPDTCWVFDPIDGTTNYAHGLPIFCSSLALEIDGELAVGGDLRSEPARSCSRPSAAGARGSTASRCTCRRADALIDSLLVHRLSLRRAERPRGTRRALRRVPDEGARGAAARVGGARPLLRRGGTVRRLLGAEAPAVGRGRRRAHRAEAGGRVTTTDGRPFQFARPAASSPRTATSTTQMLETIAGVSSAAAPGG